MRRVLKDDRLEDEFAKNGFVVVDFLTHDEAATARRFYEEYSVKRESSIGKRDNSYELSFFDNDLEKKKFIFNFLNDYFCGKWSKYLNNYEALVTNMFDKAKGLGEVPVHQNWTFVDEDKGRSVSVWIPLQDVNHENGTLEVVPGTHANFHKYRSPTIPWVFENITTQIKEKYMLPLELKVGQAAIIDDSILHYSSENKTDNPRVAIQLILKPADMPAIFYYFDKANEKLEVFQANKDFFFDLDVVNRPSNLKLLDTIPYRHHPITEVELAKFIQQHAQTV